MHHASCFHNYDEPNLRPYFAYTNCGDQSMNRKWNWPWRDSEPKSLFGVYATAGAPSECATTRPKRIIWIVEDFIPNPLIVETIRSFCCKFERKRVARSSFDLHRIRRHTFWNCDQLANICTSVLLAVQGFDLCSSLAIFVNDLGIAVFLSAVNDQFLSSKRRPLFD